MIKIYVDGELVSDSKLLGYELEGLTTTTALNKGGVATIKLPPAHPAYTRFEPYKSIVELYRDGILKFRGRPLPPTDDYYNSRTITCEGELCFFNDTAMRPYLFQDSPAEIFKAVVATHNAQASPEKQFIVGSVTVEDANDYVRLESSNAEQTFDTLNKLLERCGGYIIFTTNDDGQRVINWFQVLSYRSDQVLEFGVNLMDFTRSGNQSIATAVLPYGAQDQTTGERVTIESVNNGLDFIQDDEAVALRGMIIKPMIWDDVTEPANLLRKARQWLEENKNIITTLELTALDLSLFDKTIDTYDVGDMIPARSIPHGLDDDFLLTEKTENWLEPDDGSISLGKDVQTLTGADAAAATQTSNKLHQVQAEIRSDYTVNVEQAIQQTQQNLVTLIQQTAEALRMEVSEEYATNGLVRESISTTLAQLNDSFMFEFDRLRATVDANDASAREQFEEFHSYIRFEDGNIILGEAGNEITLKIENDRISFYDGGAEVAYFSNKKLVVLDGHYLNSLQIGLIKFVPRQSGNLSLVKAGD